MARVKKTPTRQHNHSVSPNDHSEKLRWYPAVRWRTIVVMSSHNRPVQSADVDAVSVPSSVQVTHGLVYARRDTGELLFDLYHPAVDHPVPVIIWLHGGGWFTGDRTLSPDLSQIVAQSGYAVASIDYRLSGRHYFRPSYMMCELLYDFCAAMPILMVWIRREFVCGVPRLVDT